MSDPRAFDWQRLPGIREAIEQPPTEADLSREAITAARQGLITALNWHEPPTQAAFLEQLNRWIAELELARDEAAAEHSVLLSTAARFQRERDLVTETLGRVETERLEASGQRDRAERERDDAREAARIIYAGKCAAPREWVERWPWLEET